MQDQVRVVQHDEEYGRAFDDETGGATVPVEEPTISASPDQTEESDGQTEDVKVVSEEGSHGNQDAAEIKTEVQSEIDWKSRAEELEKQAKDHQAGFTRKAQELSALQEEMKRMREQLDAIQGGNGNGQGQEVQEQSTEIPEDVQNFYEDYPEFQRAIEFEARRLADKIVGEKLKSFDPTEFSQSRKVLEDQIGFLRWQSDVMSGVPDESGNFVEGHPDFHTITAPTNKEYWKWWESKGYQPCDAITAIKRLTEYKSEKLAKAASEHKVKADSNVEEMKRTMAGALRSSGTPSREPRKSEKDFSEAFYED